MEEVVTPIYASTVYILPVARVLHSPGSNIDSDYFTKRT
jgi:hypothetical protein